MRHHHYFIRPFLLATGLALFLAACAASPTPFQEVNEDGGYADKQLEDGGYQVSFTGNAATPRRYIQESVLYRAAQITLQADREYFQVLANEVEPVEEASEAGWLGFFSGGGEALVSTVDFVLLKEQGAGNNPNIYEAKALIGELKDKVLNPEGAGAAVQGGVIVDDLRAPDRDF